MRTSKPRRRLALPAIMAMSICASPLAHAATAHQLMTVQATKRGPVRAIELSNHHGMRVRILTLGATIQSIEVPDHNGKMANVVLSQANAVDYLERPQYFGVTAGRYANRIAGARFGIDAIDVKLTANNGPNALHGGVEGFDKRLWTVDSIEAGGPGKSASVTLSYVSPDGEEGYPGTLKTIARFSLDDSNELRIDYRATTDRPTVVNLTNHAYFALAGAAAGAGIDRQLLTVNADTYLPVDDTLIPTGERRSVAGTAFDFRAPRRVGLQVRNGNDEQIRRARGYDHSFVLRGESGKAPRLAARLSDPVSGRVLEVLTTSPAVQVYSGNFLDGTIAGAGGGLYRQGDAICLEAQAFPNAPNQPSFPSTRLDPGQTYNNVIIYRFSVQADTQ